MARQEKASIIRSAHYRVSQFSGSHVLLPPSACVARPCGSVQCPTSLIPDYDASPVSEYATAWDNVPSLHRFPRAIAQVDCDGHGMRHRMLGTMSANTHAAKRRPLDPVYATRPDQEWVSSGEPRLVACGKCGARLSPPQTSAPSYHDPPIPHVALSCRTNKRNTVPHQSCFGAVTTTAPPVYRVVSRS
jgi:hypothetical protein